MFQEKVSANMNVQLPNYPIDYNGLNQCNASNFGKNVKVNIA